MSKANRTDATGSIASSGDERPWTVQQAAQFLGVSPQTVYLWVERKYSAGADGNGRDRSPFTWRDCVLAEAVKRRGFE